MRYLHRLLSRLDNRVVLQVPCIAVQYWPHCKAENASPTCQRCSNCKAFIGAESRFDRGRGSWAAGRRPGWGVGCRPIAISSIGTSDTSSTSNPSTTTASTCSGASSSCHRVGGNSSSGTTRGRARVNPNRLEKTIAGADAQYKPRSQKASSEARSKQSNTARGLKKPRSQQSQTKARKPHKAGPEAKKKPRKPKSQKARRCQEPQSRGAARRNTARKPEALDIALMCSLILRDFNCFN